MGMEGGVTMTRMKDLREKWSTFKERFLENIERYEDKEYIEEFSKIVNFYPDNVEKYTNNEVMELLSEFSSCDCPYLFEGTIFMSYGDNVSSHAKLLEESLPSFDSFQTWT